MERVTLAVALILLVACGYGGSAPASAPTTTEASDDLRMVELEDRRSRWEANEPLAYRFTVEAMCFCLDTMTRPRTVTVQDGQVVAEDPAQGDDADPDRILTVDDLFDQARIAFDDADAVEIEYSNDFDFPVTIAIDNMAEAIDDEITYVVTSFEAVSAG